MKTEPECPKTSEACSVSSEGGRKGGAHWSNIKSLESSSSFCRKTLMEKTSISAALAHRQVKPWLIPPGSCPMRKSYYNKNVPAVVRENPPLDQQWASWPGCCLICNKKNQKKQEIAPEYQCTLIITEKQKMVFFILFLFFFSAPSCTFIVWWPFHVSCLHERNNRKLTRAQLSRGNCCYHTSHFIQVRPQTSIITCNNIFWDHYN